MRKREDVFTTGFTDTIKYLDFLEKQIIRANNDTVKNFTKEGVKIVNENASMYVSDVEDKKADVAFNNNGRVLALGSFARAEIVNDDPDAVFIEFGTGMVGMRTPHPTPNVADWKYYVPSPYKKVSKFTGKEGWFNKGKFWEGVPSMPFMYYGGNEISRLIGQWYIKNFERRMKV